MSWRQITMKFDGDCAVCGKAIKAGVQVLWLKGEGVKHEACAVQAHEVECAVCGRGAGCASCEYRDDCDIERVSQMCICPRCSENDALPAYYGAVAKRFTILNHNKKIGQATL